MATAWHVHRVRAFDQLDVFSDQLGRGNPLAVVHDAADLTDEQLATFARWTNLSETTFLLPPTDPAADYRVRIFTPARELPFAGHPTLGSARAWLHRGGRAAEPGLLIQQCQAGLVRVRQDGARLAFAAPPLIRDAPVADDERAAIASNVAGAGRGGAGRALGRQRAWLVGGPAGRCADRTGPGTRPVHARTPQDRRRRGLCRFGRRRRLRGTRLHRRNRTRRIRSPAASTPASPSG